MLKERLGSSFDRVVHRLIPILTRIPLSPDQWSLLGVAFSALAAGSLAAGSLALAGSWMFCAGFCDIVDGAVARARHQEGYTQQGQADGSGEVKFSDTSRRLPAKKVASSEVKS